MKPSVGDRCFLPVALWPHHLPDFLPGLGHGWMGTVHSVTHSTVHFHAENEAQVHKMSRAAFLFQCVLLGEEEEADASPWRHLFGNDAGLTVLRGKIGWGAICHPISIMRFRMVRGACKSRIVCARTSSSQIIRRCSGRQWQ